MSAILAWRRKPRPVPIAGQYAGRARFQPRYIELVPDELEPAIGEIVEFGFAGVAPVEDICGGQNLYLEWRCDAVLHGFVIPEQDLQFIQAPRLNEASPVRLKPDTTSVLSSL